MKFNTLLLCLLCLLHIGTLSAQGLCTDFESGQQAWQTNDASASISSPALDGSDFLRLKDGGSTPGSISCGFKTTVAPYQNWNSSCGKLCFDYKVFNDGYSSSTSTLRPKITIYQGAHPNSATIKATFIGSAQITENSPWVRVCAPVHDINGNSLPSNSDGYWSMSNPSQWNTLISNVSGVYFHTDIDGSSSVSEVVGVDNVCIEICEPAVLANGEDITNANSFNVQCGKSYIELEAECLENFAFEINTEIDGIEIIGNKIYFPLGLVSDQLFHPAIELVFSGEHCDGTISNSMYISFDTDCCETEISHAIIDDCNYFFWLTSEHMVTECEIWQVNGETVNPNNIVLENGTNEICVFYLGYNYRNPDFLCTCEEKCITIEVNQPEYCFDIPDQVCIGQPILLDMSCSDQNEADSYRINIHNSQWQNVWWMDFSGPFFFHDLNNYYEFEAGETYTITVDFRYDCSGETVTKYHDVEIICCDDFCFDIPDQVCYGNPIPLDFSCSNTDQVDSYRINIHNSQWQNVWWMDFSGPLSNHDLSAYYNFQLNETYTITVDFRYVCDGTVQTLYHDVTVVCCSEYCFDIPDHLCIGQPFVVDFSCNETDQLESYRINVNDEDWNNIWFEDFSGPLSNFNLSNAIDFQLWEEYTVTVDFRYACGEVVTVYAQTITAHSCDNSPIANAERKISLNKKFNFTIYPNPSDGIFNVALDKNEKSLRAQYQITILDGHGKEIQAKTGSSDGQTEQLDLTNEPAGIYFIKISYGKNVCVKKIIKG